MGPVKPSQPLGLTVYFSATESRLCLALPFFVCLGYSTLFLEWLFPLLCQPAFPWCGKLYHVSSTVIVCYFKDHLCKPSGRNRAGRCIVQSHSWSWPPHAAHPGQDPISQVSGRAFCVLCARHPLPVHWTAQRPVIGLFSCYKNAL